MTEEQPAVTLLRADEKASAILHELMADSDWVMQVDCASARVPFAVNGWFCFPRGSISGPVPVAVDKPA